MSSDGTSSTSGSTVTGLKKWIPMTCSGRFVAIPSFMIGIDEVLEASTASGAETTLSSVRNSSTFMSSISGTASTTISRSASASASSVKVMRAKTDS